ncbi:hypothetical protein B0H13DRAFT_2387252 [Mycena leptocephala]|nr:hypothetical protein B0H13DRAFT_2387252 [Mycena leptocephala]
MSPFSIVRDGAYLLIRAHWRLIFVRNGAGPGALHYFAFDSVLLRLMDAILFMPLVRTCGLSHLRLSSFYMRNTALRSTSLFTLLYSGAAAPLTPSARALVLSTLVSTGALLPPVFHRIPLSYTLSALATPQPYESFLHLKCPAAPPFLQWGPSSCTITPLSPCAMPPSLLFTHLDVFEPYWAPSISSRAAPTSEFLALEVFYSLRDRALLTGFLLACGGIYPF